MPARMRQSSNGSSGFTAAELVFLLFLVIVFLVGVVLLTDRGVGSVRLSEAPTTLSEQGSRLMKRIEAITRDARLFMSPVYRFSGRWSQTLDFLVDIDGDKSTGHFHCGNAKGLERVVITRPGLSDPRLVVQIYEGSGGVPPPVTISRILSRDRAAFRVEYLSGSAGSAGSGPAGTLLPVGANDLNVVVSLTEGGRSEKFENEFHLTFAPVRISAAQVQ